MRLRSPLVVLLLLLLGSCTSPASSPNPDTRTAGTQQASGPLSASEVAIGFDVPWGLVVLADDSLLVSERDTGRILQVRGGVSTELARIADVAPIGEGGLLGLASSPDAGTVFAYFTSASDNRIVAMSWDGNRLGEPRPILTGIPRGSRHDGGRLLIGPDGLLYVGTGEAGDPGLSQDKDSLGGKILRLALDGQPAPGNPFGDEVYSYGHRNVQGLAFDPEGRLWASEFGESAWDELNLIEPGGNYGWPLAEGSGDESGLINPEVVWRTGEASPSGLAFWDGSLWMASLRGERLWEIPLNGTEPGAPVAHFAEEYGRLRSVVVAPDGAGLLLTASNTDGRGDPRPGDDKILRISR